MAGSLGACSPTNSTTEAPAPASSVEAKPAPTGVAAEVMAAMDGSADPCTDFYQYACGGWMQSTELPADKPLFVRSFSAITDRNQELVKQLLEDAAANPGDDPDRQRIGHLFGSCMDEAAVEKAGITPIAPHLEKVAAVKTTKDAFAMAGELSAMGAAEPFISMGAYPDFKNPSTNVLIVEQGGLGLPDRDFYLEERHKPVLEAYTGHVERMFVLAGIGAEQAKTDAAAVVAFETSLAQISMPAAELRDLQKNYHKIDIKGLKALDRRIPWKAYFQALGRPDIVQANVQTPDFVKGMGKLVRKATPDVMRAYLRWHLLSGTADRLNNAFVQERFTFRSAITGQREMQPRWKRCVNHTSSAFGQLIGKLYADKAFAGDSKQIALNMIQDVEASFERNLPGLTWMDDATRAAAQAKAKMVTNKIGYPDKWRDFSGVKTSPDNFFANTENANRFNHDFHIAKADKPVDKAEWFMSPSTVNAYYNPTWNEMVFPAGILQPPFFDAEYPLAMNYGAIGMVMGHELSHGFDDQGRKFTGEGVMKEWWAPEVAAKFEAQAKCVVDQYASFEVQPGVNVNGELTLGENIADLGGMKQTYEAYKKRTAENPETSPVEGLTPEQLLFVAYGQAWCTKSTPEVEKMRVTVDPHSPPRFRVNGAVMNTPAFWEAFSCTEGTPMHPKNACEVW